MKKEVTAWLSVKNDHFRPTGVLNGPGEPRWEVWNTWNRSWRSRGTVLMCKAGSIEFKWWFIVHFNKNMLKSFILLFFYYFLKTIEKQNACTLKWTPNLKMHFHRFKWQTLFGYILFENKFHFWTCDRSCATDWMLQKQKYEDTWFRFPLQ